MTHGPGLVEAQKLRRTDADSTFKGVTYVDIRVAATCDRIRLGINLSYRQAAHQRGHGADPRRTDYGQGAEHDARPLGMWRRV